MILLRRSCTWSVVLAVLLLASGGCEGGGETSQPASSDVASAGSGGAVCNNDRAVDPSAPRCQHISKANECCPVPADGLSPDLPIDLCSFNFPGWTPRQADVDHFSWLQLVALQWPADLTAERGTPDRSARPGATNPDGSSKTAVWQTWKSYEEIFPSSGTPSKKWNDPPPPPPSICPQLDGPLFTRTSKVDDQLEDNLAKGINQAVGGPLVDRDGNLVLYEVRVNRREFEVITNGGYNVGNPVPAAFKWPADDLDTGRDGVVELKAAWKQLTEEEWNAGTYFQQWGLFYYPGDKETKPTCEKVRVGLVGFHVAHKIASVSVIQGDKETEKGQWIWTTFEHQGNVPAVGETGSGSYAFFDATCTPEVTAEQCQQAATTQPNPDKAYRCCANLWRWTAIGDGADDAPLSQPRTADQVTRIDPLFIDEGCTKAFEHGLAGTIWSDYFLVGTQWFEPSPDGVGDSMLEPPNLRNTTLETYLTKWTGSGSDLKQVNTSSCNGCHSAGVDHSFLLSRSSG